VGGGRMLGSLEVEEPWSTLEVKEPTYII
jgi:hypothetical protein